MLECTEPIIKVGIQRIVSLTHPRMYCNPMASSRAGSRSGPTTRSRCSCAVFCISGNIIIALINSTNSADVVLEPPSSNDLAIYAACSSVAKVEFHNCICLLSNIHYPSPHASRDIVQKAICFPRP
jgi:hypothetical protein